MVAIFYSSSSVFHLLRFFFSLYLFLSFLSVCPSWRFFFASSLRIIKLNERRDIKKNAHQHNRFLLLFIVVKERGGGGGGGKCEERERE